MLSLPSALHADLGVLAQPCRVLVLDPDGTPTPARCLSWYRCPWSRHQRLHRCQQPAPQAVRLDQDSRRDPRQRRSFLSKNFQLTPL